MPDASATAMVPDTLDRPLPALSATSDAVELEEVPALSATEPGQKEENQRRDPKTGRFVTVDNQAEAKEDTPAAPEVVVEPADGGKQSVEVTATDQKAELSPAEQAVLRYKGEIDALRGELNQLRSLIPKPEAPKPQPRPTYDQFESPEAYETALTNWAETEGARKALEKSEQDRREAQARQRAAEVSRTWNQRTSTFKADHPDYDQVTGPDDLGKPINIPIHIGMAIAELENGPAVEYHLGQNRAEADRIAGLHPITGAAEIGRLAARLSEPVKAAQPKPKPAPIRPVGERSASLTKSPDEMTTEEYAEHMRQSGRLKFGTR